MKKVDLVLILGPSGVGKTTLANIFRDKLNLTLVPTFTTRPPRKDDGPETHFVDSILFDELEFSETDKFGIHQYGTPTTLLMEAVMDEGMYCVKAITPKGARQLRKAHPELGILTVCLLPRSLHDVERRLAKRKDKRSVFDELEHMEECVAASDLTIGVSDGVGSLYYLSGILHGNILANGTPERVINHMITQHPAVASHKAGALSKIKRELYQSETLDDD